MQRVLNNLVPRPAGRAGRRVCWSRPVIPRCHVPPPPRRPSRRAVRRPASGPASGPAGPRSGSARTGPTGEEVLNESRCPHVLVSADAPNIINVVNDKFTHKFGCSHAQALGQPLAIIQADHRPAWRSLLAAAAAAAGRIARSNVSVRQPWFSPGRAGENATNNDSKESDVICVPVVDVPNGPISNILVLFAPSRPHADSEAAGCLSPAAAGDDGRVLSRAGPIIRPRRKILADGTVALPEAVTLTLAPRRRRRRRRVADGLQEGVPQAGPAPLGVPAATKQARPAQGEPAV